MTCELQELLSRQELVNRLREALDGWSKIGEVIDAQNDEWEKQSLGSCRRRIIRDCFGSIYEESVAPDSPHPTAITRKDFVNVCENTLIAQSDAFEQGVEDLKRTLLCMASIHRQTRPFSVILGHFTLGNGASVSWQSKTGLQVVLVSDVVFDKLDLTDSLPTGRPKSVLRFRAQGACTVDALRTFQREIRRVLRSILYSVILVQPRNTPVSGSSFWVVSLLLDAYYANPTKKDSMDRRIRNALRLLVQADMQEHHAIAISLLVAGVEALVCKKGPDLSNMFAENTACILEPDPRFRADAVEFMKGLYDARSRTLHGEMLDEESDVRRRARVITATVLTAILERREFQKRAGVGYERPDDLLSELKKGKWTSGQLTGVSEYWVRDLWRRPRSLWTGRL